MITVKGYLRDKVLPKGYITKKRLRTTDLRETTEPLIYVKRSLMRMK